MKPLNQFHKQFKVADDAYGQTIKELSLIVQKSFIATSKAFERLEPHEVAQILVESQNWRDRGFRNRSMAVWTLRKKKLNQ